MLHKSDTPRLDQTGKTHQDSYIPSSNRQFRDRLMPGTSSPLLPLPSSLIHHHLTPTALQNIRPRLNNPSLHPGPHRPPLLHLQTLQTSRSRDHEGTFDAPDDALGTTQLIPGAQRTQPGITFFHEPLTPEYSRAWEEDWGKVDLVLVMGTSLPVEPVKDLPCACYSLDTRLEGSQAEERR